MSKKVNKEKALVLSSAEPINDGGRKYNVIYYVSIIACSILFLAMGSNVLGIVFGAILGLIVGWLIKNKLLETMAISLRTTKFMISNKVPYSELINRLIPVLTPLGAMIEKSSDVDGKPVISFQGAMYDIGYNDDNTFYIWWRQNLAKAFLTVDYISIYRKEVAAMGIIGYHIQQVCDKYNISEVCCKDTEQKNHEDAKPMFCKECGSPLTEEAQFCANCGSKI